MPKWSSCMRFGQLRKMLQCHSPIMWGFWNARIVVGLVICHWNNRRKATSQWRHPEMFTNSSIFASFRKSSFHTLHRARLQNIRILMISDNTDLDSRIAVGGSRNRKQKKIDGWESRWRHCVHVPRCSTFLCFVRGLFTAGPGMPIVWCRFEWQCSHKYAPAGADAAFSCVFQSWALSGACWVSMAGYFH